ncbi:hypothetical protein MJO29_011320 [Puccinia striiformis f. sp. tritici]|uniref:hypothetical protein n=1 Tax=Puccinia striiformis f. sp. tritici TaxID=168172 RepID=UPI000A12972A|nr:hypothetical protein Pst134EA_021157 [Puccinia striiformis f. sp. tritici]KAH9457273.1 hypothetical protein Pst134EA_021157 [Puccinia striiformis f. sp. tritici]KAI7946793.1 hypothetical protein MJO29_011320 [Puccinia striiformis f. sp. tritici]KAI9614822.1 hypothetical protein H4Q26_009218 [Puccinia striiformis f. sp. tritici PST-130]
MENHREQGELVFQGFKRLASKCKPKNDRRSRSTGETVDVERVGPAEATIQLNRLQSDLLPLLQQRLTILSGLMKKSSLKGGQADSNLRSILVIQGEVEHNLDQIRAALYILCPEKPNDVVPNQTDDQHDEHVKFFKLHGLNKWLTMHLFPHLLLRFGESRRLIEQLGLARENCNYPIDIRSTREGLYHYSDYNNYTLQKAIEWINGSELDNLHERWSIGLLDINIHLRDLSRRRPPHNLQSDGAIVVADSLIPVMKLSRMFFSKLSRKGMNVKRLPMFTKMSSDQLEKLAKSASDLDTNSSKFRPIYMDENFMEEFPRDLFIKTANQLKNILEPALLSILIYYIPIIPNDDDDSLRSGLSTVQTRDYFYAWFVEWFVSFNLSIQNFIKTVESIQDE